MPSTGRRIAVDVGQARVGVAESDPDGILASPVTTLKRDLTPAAADQSALAEIVARAGAHVVYVGLPLSLDGGLGAAAELARAYAVSLAGRVAPARVRLVDERFTTVESHRRLHDSGRPGRAHREVVDQVAAVLILHAALDAERATGQQAGEWVRPGGRKPRTKERR